MLAITLEELYGKAYHLGSIPGGSNYSRRRLNVSVTLYIIKITVPEKVVGVVDTVAVGIVGGAVVGGFSNITQITPWM